MLMNCICGVNYAFTYFFFPIWQRLKYFFGPLCAFVSLWHFSYPPAVNFDMLFSIKTENGTPLSPSQRKIVPCRRQLIPILVGPARKFQYPLFERGRCTEYHLQSF